MFTKSDSNTKMDILNDFNVIKELIDVQTHGFVIKSCVDNVC